MRWYGGWAARFAWVILLAVSGEAAVFGPIEFDDDAEGWTHQSGGALVVSHTDSFGQPAGSLHGAFAEQVGVPSAETDAFRATTDASSAALTGNYWSSVPGFTSWTFSFYADDVLPSDLIIRVGNGVNTFVRNVLPQVSLVDSWLTVSVSLDYAGWFGGSATTFSNVLSNVTLVEVQFSRNGAGAQDFYLDNFFLNGPDPGGAGSAIPEPGAGLLVLAGAVLIFGWRRHQGVGRTEPR